MPKIIDIAGQVFGSLTVLSRVPATGQALWLCRCSCGKEHVAPGYNLRKGLIKSCGCLKKELAAKINLSHGYSCGSIRKKEYTAWLNMRNRCNRQSSSDYQRYGELGIQVCQQWQNSFKTFLSDMGNCPDGYSLDRINPLGNYEPSNCRWADLDTQQNNKKRIKQITINGETLSVAQWCKKLGISHRTIRARIYEYGWDAIKAITTPIRN